MPGCLILATWSVENIERDVSSLDEVIPSDNADMSNDKGITPRLKLMVFWQLSASKLFFLQM